MVCPHPLPSIAWWMSQASAAGESLSCNQESTIWLTDWLEGREDETRTWGSSEVVLTKTMFFDVQKQCINLINPMLFPHMKPNGTMVQQFVTSVVQSKKRKAPVTRWILVIQWSNGGIRWHDNHSNMQTCPSSPSVETQVLSVVQGRLHCCGRRLACLEQLTEVLYWMCKGKEMSWGQISPHHPIRPESLTSRNLHDENT